MLAHHLIGDGDGKATRRWEYHHVVVIVIVKLVRAVPLGLFRQRPAILFLHLLQIYAIVLVELLEQRRQSLLHLDQ